jgi:cell division protein FtsA
MVTRSIQAVGLDVGTSKVRCIIGEVSEEGKLSIIGIGESDSRGLRRGIVTTTETVSESIKKAVDEAEKMSGVEVEMATVNLSGEHLQGANKSGVVAVAGIEKEISNEDVERAIESASAMSLPAGWEIVDKLPQEFIIDGQDGIIEPVGMKGSRLESRVHVVTGPSAGRQNTVKAINNIGLEIEYMMLEPLAAAEAVLTDDDKEYGCAIVNMGAEITNLMIFGRGAVQHTVVFPFGGMHFTKDIAVGLRVSIPEAERIKCDFGCVAKFLMSADEKQQIIEITPVGRTETRQLSKEILCDIMQPRAIELLQHISEEVRNAGHQISSGVILTGGSAMIPGIVELAEQVFDSPTRIGKLERGRFEGLTDNIKTPDWAVACGLVYSSFKTQLRENRGSKSPTQKVAQWFENFREKFR